ncbi:MAG: single-stranded-DNA-specific exonuclease RecJ [Rhodospirillales bacterium]|nr:single-stranded-DNA-specific exonuclease RecJ [Rhodospirillales bacterium]MCB9995540.1 single-stranded-DNA-specific exonuclease RecJ [Rhodospirillales bacterium]
MTDYALNVERSLSEARWVLPQAEQELVAQIAQQYGLPEIVARLLTARGVAPEQVESFLYPKLAQHFPDPFSLKGMRALADDLAAAIEAGRKIAVFGDFDVDGATSTAILVRFFRHLGIEVPFYIPDRLKEGYGPNENALRILKERGTDIVLMCDCGTTAFDVLAAGKEIGLDIAVIDHHQAEERMPECWHLINPKRQDDVSGLDMLAAVGVTFMVCVALNARLREAGYFTKNGLSEVPLKSWLDIVALGTVCDMVPLTGPNRLLVRSGFEQMAKRQNPGISALCDVAGVSSAPNTYHAGFVLGPRINAGSRVHQADLGARLLSTDSAEEAKNIAWTLNDCNEKRKEIQDEMMTHAESIVEAQRLQDAPVIVVGDESWHPGLSGLVAGRLREKYDKPSIVITYAPGDDAPLEGRGSGRSIPGVNIGAAFIDARNEGVLVKGGGHAMAAGFTVMPDRVEDLRAFLTAHVEKQLGGQTPVSETTVDGVLSARGAQVDFVKLLQDHVGPFGQENPEPLFVLPNVRLHMVDIVGKDHVRAQISDWEGGPRLKAVAFRAAETPMGQAMLKQGGNQPFHIAGHFKLDTWNGQERVEMHIQDVAFAMEGQQSEKLSA